MNIKIKDYIITADSYNYILNKKSIAKTTTKSQTKGDIIIKPVAFFTNIETLIQRLIELELRRTDVTTLKELVQAYKSIKPEILGYFNTKKEKRNER